MLKYNSPSIPIIIEKVIWRIKRNGFYEGNWIIWALPPATFSAFYRLFSAFRTYNLRAGVCGRGMCSGGHFRNHMLRAGTRQMGNSENRVPCLCSMVLVFKVMQNELKSWTAHFEEAPHRKDLSCIFGLSKRIIIILHCIGGGGREIKCNNNSQFLVDEEICKIRAMILLLSLSG